MSKNLYCNAIPREFAIFQMNYCSGSSSFITFSSMKYAEKKIKMITYLKSKTNIDKATIIDIHCLQINNLKFISCLSTYHKRIRQTAGDIQTLKLRPKNTKNNIFGRLFILFLSFYRTNYT